MRSTASCCPTGERTDGRMLPLNSYENRVYQVGMEDGPPVVAKFYRPHRWSDAAILEEHAFVAELVRREIPGGVRRACSTARRCIEFEGFRFSIFERRGGRAPDHRPQRHARMARALHRADSCGGRNRAVSRAADARYPELRLRAARVPADARLRARTTCARRMRRVVAMALEGVERCFERAGDVAPDPPARRLSSEQRAVDRRGPAFRRFRRQPHGPGDPGSLAAAAGRARGGVARARPICSPATKISAISSRANCIWSRRCARCG